MLPGLRAGALALMTAILLFPPPAMASQGTLSGALVDVSPNTVLEGTNVAIWTSSNVSLSAGTAITYIFPPSLTVTAISPGTCNCLYMRFTKPGSGIFTPDEVTVTAGSVDQTENSLTAVLPQDIAAGKFYVRIDPAAGMANPCCAGLMTLKVVDSDGNSTTSKPFMFLPTTGPQDFLVGTLQGKVTHADQEVPSTLIMVKQPGAAAYHPLQAGPRAQPLGAQDMDQRVFAQLAEYNGEYRIRLPVGDYSAYAVAWRHDGSVAVAVTSTVSNVSITDAAPPVTLDFTLPAMP